MSYAVSWIAVRGKRPEEVRRVLGLQASGVWHEEPNYPIAAARLATGWYLVRTEGLTSMLCEPGVASQLSEDCEVVTCCLNEDDYHSAAEQWENGKRLWGIQKPHHQTRAAQIGAGPCCFLRYNFYSTAHKICSVWWIFVQTISLCIKTRYTP